MFVGCKVTTCKPVILEMPWLTSISAFGFLVSGGGGEVFPRTASTESV